MVYIGYMVLGLGLFTPLALAGSVFYLIHHIIVKANLFLISGLVRRIGGGEDLHQLGGLYRHAGGLAVLFLIPAFSLAGFPPLSGFWAKFVLLQAAFDAGAYLAGAVALVVGLLTVYSMTKIWLAVFWSPAEDDSRWTDRRVKWWKTPLLVPVAVLAALTVLIGIGAQPCMEIALAAAEELLAPERYVQAVMGGGP